MRSTETLLATSSTTIQGRRGYWLGMGVIIGCALSFGLITTFAHLAYSGGASPTLLVLGRFLGFTAVIGAFFAATGRSVRLPARNMKASAVLAIPMMMMSVGYLASVAFISVSLAVILLYSFPLMVALLAAISGRERMTMRKVLVMMVAFGGLMLAIGGDWGSLDWRGVALALTAALGIAGTMTWAQPYLEGVDTVAVNLWTNLWMLIAFAVYVAVSGGVALPPVPLGWLGFGGATLFYTLGFILFFGGMKLLPPAEAAVMLNIEPVVSLTAAALVLGESTRPLQWLGVAIMLSALCFSALAGAKRAA